VSRSRIFQLLPLTQEHLRRVLFAALADAERGYGNLNVTIDPDAVDHLVEVANGDARGVLNALELAVETTPPAPDGTIHITLAVAEESIQRRAVLYDKEGDYHFDTISAFIKSLRGSDADAALYWMAKMIYAGESPRFIFRRMLIFAGEDIGMADPNAIQVVTACAQAFEQVGLPEGRFHLGLAALYLSTAKKSNSGFAFFDALAQVEKEGDSGVPAHLRDSNRDAEGFGHGEGYLYPHAFRDHWVAQQYLPASLQGKIFYQPSDQGYEAAIAETVARRREAQLAAMLEGDATDAPVEILTFSPDDPQRQRWLQRVISNAGARLGSVRDRVLDAARLPRHAVALDLRAGSGLLTWELVRRLPEGGVVALARTARDADALREMAERLDAMVRPTIIQGEADELPLLLRVRAASTQAASPERFDALVGINALLDAPDKSAAAALLAGLLAEGGVISLAERIPCHTQRLYALVDASALPANLTARWHAAEEAIYTPTPKDAGAALVGWDADDLAAAFTQAGLKVEMTIEDEQTDMQVTPALLQRWFGAGTADKPSYADRLAAQLSPAEVAQVRALMERQLGGQVVAWGSRTVYVVARKI
jgi:putative ATPase